MGCKQAGLGRYVFNAIGEGAPGVFCWCPGTPSMVSLTILHNFRTAHCLLQDQLPETPKTCCLSFPSRSCHGRPFKTAIWPPARGC